MSLFQVANPSVYLVSARHGDERAGMIATWITQATLSAQRPRLLAVISTDTHTQRLIRASRHFAVQLLDAEQQAVVARFALPLAGGADKWEGFEARTTAGGRPLVADSCGFADCAVTDEMHTGDRVVYLADVVEEREFEGREPLREADALARQPEDVAAGLRRSYEIDVGRDDTLLRAADASGSETAAASEPETLMRLAIEKTREGLARGQGPFGCAIARGGELLALEHNRVFEQVDITAHAEITALRAASRRAGEFRLPGAVVAATCEPCPMCMTALYFAGVETVFFGASIADAEAAGFRQIPLSAERLVELGGETLRVVPGLLAEECRTLFAAWRDGKASRPY